MSVPSRQSYYILLALSGQDLHGSGIARAVHEGTGGEIRLWPAMLYGTLELMTRERLIEELAPEDWNETCSTEGWSVGVTAHHIAAGYAATLQYVPAMMSGDMPPVTWDMLHQANAQHAEQFADVSRAETLNLLRADGERVSAWLNSLGADDLAQTIALPLMGDEPVSLQSVIEAFVIGHIAMHQASIEAAL